MDEFPVVATACRAWKDIGYYCTAEAYEHWLEVKVYFFYIWKDFGETEWDGSPFPVGVAPPGYVFDKAEACCTPDPVRTVDEAQVFLSGSVKWDGCANLRFDQQDEIMLHFCNRQEAVNVGVLLGRLYDLAEELVPAYDKPLAER